MSKEKEYRKIIYENYEPTLSTGQLYNDENKEKKLMRRYFERNYLSEFPTDRGISILDIGCGKGMYINACLENGYDNVTGIDLSLSNIDFCISQGYKVEQQDMMEFLVKKNNQYDVIMFNDVIEHLKKDEIFEILFRMRSALKENGMLIVKTINAANPYVASSGRYVTFDHEIAFTDASLGQILRSSGFSVVEIKALDIYVTGSPIDWIAKFIASLICCSLYMKSLLFGRRSIRIFTKSIIAFAKK